MMLETWKKATNNKNKVFGALLTNLSKAFVCWSEIYWLLSFVQMLSTYYPVPNCSGSKVHFWTNFLTHFTFSFFTFTRDWLEKALLSFEGFRQISKMLQDDRKQLIENKEQKKLFLQLIGKDTISGTTGLYPRSTFIPDLYPWHLPNIEDQVLYWLRRW